MRVRRVESTLAERLAEHRRGLPVGQPSRMTYSRASFRSRVAWPPGSPTPLRDPERRLLVAVGDDRPGAHELVAQRSLGRDHRLERPGLHHLDLVEGRRDAIPGVLE